MYFYHYKHRHVNCHLSIFLYDIYQIRCACPCISIDLMDGMMSQTVIDDTNCPMTHPD